MIDDPGIYMPDWDPAPIPEPVPAVTLDPEPAPEPEPAPAPEPEPEEPSSPIEVIPVEDLLDRLTGGSQSEEKTEEPPQEAEGEAPSEFLEAPSGNVPVMDGEPIQVVGMDTALERLETIQGTVDHPLLTTPFEDYTVTEGLLLLLFLSVFAAACVKMLKGGFAWLR